MKTTFSSFVAVILLTITMAFAQQSPVFVKDGKAIRGYDPVAFFTESKPVLGDSTITYAYQEATWQFTSAANRDAFKDKPEKYAPQYGGYCAYGTADGTGHKAPTQPDTWTIQDDNRTAEAAVLQLQHQSAGIVEQRPGGQHQESRHQLASHQRQRFSLIPIFYKLSLPCADICYVRFYC